MRVFYQNVAIVISFLKERGYAEQTIQNHESFYNKLADYLVQTMQEYHPDLGRSLILERTEGPCRTGSRFGNAACILHTPRYPRVRSTPLLCSVKSIRSW